jgi:hypothetical protein
MVNQPASLRYAGWVGWVLWGGLFRDQNIDIRAYEYIHHKVHTYKEYHSVCALVGNGTLPPPLSPASVPLPPEPNGAWEAHSSAGEGLGESQFQRLEKKLSTLPTR